MKQIKLTRNKITVVDDEDFEYLIKEKWYCNAQFYAIASKTIDGKRVKVRMHRLIMNCPKDKIIDHINGNTLDNRKCNLRICDSTGNAHNSKKPKNNTSGYKGISFVKRVKKYRAYITICYKQIHLGYFEKIEDAIAKQKKAAKQYHGEFVRYD